MKPGVIIVNPASAELFDKAALLNEFRKDPTDRRIHTLILDMPFGGRRDEHAFEADSANAELKNHGVLFTPRIAGYAHHTREKAATALSSQVNTALAKQPYTAPDDLERLTRDIIELAREAGEIAKAIQESGLKVTHKVQDNSPVTQADPFVEKMIREGLIARGHTHVIFSGEEIGKKSASPTDFEVVIDGIDGTRNFAEGIFGWATSISVRRNGETLIGVVHDPKSNETFHAIKGNGAYVSDEKRTKKLQLPENPPKAFLFSIGSFRIKGSSLVKHELIEFIKTLGGRQREWGSIALSLCTVAKGAFGIFIQGESEYHDYGAGALIAAEAGANITLLSSRDSTKHDIIAAHPQLARPLESEYARRVTAISRLANSATRISAGHSPGAV